MFFASGFFYNNSNNSTSFSNLSLTVMVQGAENVMAVSNPNSKRIAAAWGERGGIYAMHVARTSTNWSLEHFLGQGNRSYGVDLAATVFERFLQPDEGFQYLIVDEVGNDAALWKNGGEMAWRFEEWLQRLAKDGYDHRVLLYFNLYNMVQTITEFGQVLRACAGALVIAVQLLPKFTLAQVPCRIQSQKHRVTAPEISLALRALLHSLITSCLV